MNQSLSPKKAGKKQLAKILLIGDGGVGKTTLCRTYVDEGNIQESQKIHGVNWAGKEFTIDNTATKSSYDFKCQIWDLAAYPRFNAVRELYYRGAHGALCCFEVTNYESFRNVREWIKAFWSFNGRGIQPVMIVGTKSDLRGNPAFPSQVKAKIAQIYARELSVNVQPKYGFNVHYIEISAKNNLNVDEPFRLLANEIINHRNFMTGSEGGFVTGGGWFNSPVNAYLNDPTLTGKANFDFVSKYKKGAQIPTGKTTFHLRAADLNFQSSNYDWLIITGSKAMYKGTGTINGQGDYRFLLTVTDGQKDGGGGYDRIRIRIWDKITGIIIYDNQLNDVEDADATTIIQTGSIVIHKM